MFTTSGDFGKTPYKIPNLDDAETLADFNSFINDKEQEVLTELLGRSLYVDLIAGLAVGSPLAKWIDLRDGVDYENEDLSYKYKGLKSFLVPYIYSQWVAEKPSYFVGDSVVVAENENSSQIGSGLTVEKAYNDFVDKVGNMYNTNYGDNLYSYLVLHPIDYPTIDYGDFNYSGEEKMNFLDL